MQSSYQPSRKVALLVLGALILAGTLLRVYNLTAQGVWRDEAATWFQSSGTFADIFTRTAADNYPPLDNILTFIAIKAFGTDAWALRLPSLLVGIGCIPLIYGLGAKIGGRTVGLVAAGLLALSGFHIWYSQEARGYVLLAAASMGFAWATLSFVEKPGRWQVVASILSGLALVYTHPFGALTWLAIAFGACLVLQMRRNGSQLLDLALIEGAIALGFLPWAVILAARADYIDQKGFWAPDITPATIYQAIAAPLSQLHIVLLCILLVAAPVWWRRRKSAALGSGSGIILLCWAILPLLGGIIASLLVEPILVPRYVIGSVPAVLIACGIAVTEIVQGRRTFALAGAAVVVAGSASIAFGTPEKREDWQHPIQQAAQQIGDGDCYAVQVGLDVLMLDYFTDIKNRCVILLSRDDALDQVPPRATIYYISNWRSPETLKKLSETRTKQSEAHFYKGHLYVFAPRPGPS